MIHIHNTLKFLNLEQYRDEIEVVEFIQSTSKFDVWIKIHNTSCTCPNCSTIARMPIKDYQTTVVTHACLRRYPVYLHVSRPRVRCSNCGRIFSLSIPFVFNTFPKVSAYTVVSVLDDLKNTNKSFAEIARSHWISDITVAKIMSEHVHYANVIPTSYICIDEKCYAHGNTKYCLPILDHSTNKLIDVLKNRKKATLIEWLRNMRDMYTTSSKDKSKLIVDAPIEVKMFCIDMSQHYFDAISLVFPKVPIAVDSFHVIENIEAALKMIRVKVMNSFYVKARAVNERTGELLDEEIADARQPKEYRALKKYWKLIQTNQIPKALPAEKKHYNKILSKYVDSSDILDYLLTIDERLTTAWELKTMYVDFNNHATSDNAEPWLDQLIMNFADSNIKQFVDLSAMLTHWKPQILNSFTLINGRRISNGPIEGMNAQIEKVIINGNGIPNFNTLRERILLMYGIHGSYKI